MDKYKDKRPAKKVLPTRRTRSNSQCVSKMGTMKSALSEKKAKARGAELNMRAYPCDRCPTIDGHRPWHLTKQMSPPEGQGVITQGEVDSMTQRELDLLIRRRGNGCPNDTDGDGGCHLCARDPNFHWRATAARIARS